MSTPLDVLNAAYAAADAALASALQGLGIAQAALGMSGGTLAWTVGQTGAVTLSLTFASMDPATGSTADTEATAYLAISTLDSPTLQMALAALPNVGAGNVSVSGLPGGPWIVTLTGALANNPQPLGALTGSVTGTGAVLSIVPYNPPIQPPGSDQSGNLVAAQSALSAAVNTYNSAVTSVQNDVAAASGQVPSMATSVGPISNINVSIATGGTPDCASADIEAGVNAAIDGMISQVNTVLGVLSSTLEAMKNAHQNLINAVNTFQSVELQTVTDTEAEKAALTAQINGMFP